MSNRDSERERYGEHDPERRRFEELERARGRSSRWFGRAAGFGPEDEYGREGWTGFGAEGDWEGGYEREGGYAALRREDVMRQRPELRHRGGYGRSAYWGPEERFRRSGQEGEFGGPGGTYREEYGRRGEGPSYRMGYGGETPEWGRYGGGGYWQDYGWGHQWPQGRQYEGYAWPRQREAYFERLILPRFGRYSGRGPRGYQRSDERIREDINDHLTENGDIDATDVEVQVQNAEVVLRGSVGSRFEKRLAEDLADSIPGVRDVRNEMRVQRPEERREAA